MRGPVTISLAAAMLSLLLLVCCFVVIAVVDAQQGDINYQAIKMELFLDNELDDDLPCESPDNFTLTFRDMEVNTGKCTTHLFPQYSLDEGTKWIQFSAKAFARDDGGLQVWLYFTRNENTGAITYCTEQNIGGMPYPLEISADLNGQCYVIDLPHLDPYSSEEEAHSMAVRISYDQDAITSIVSNRTATQQEETERAQAQAAQSAEDSSGY